MKPILLCVCLLLAGCEPSVTEKPEGWIQVSSGDGVGAVKEITMPSGTKCVVLMGYYKGAVSCDWNK